MEYGGATLQWVPFINPKFSYKINVFFTQSSLFLFFWHHVFIAWCCAWNVSLVLKELFFYLPSTPSLFFLHKFRLCLVASFSVFTHHALVITCSLHCCLVHYLRSCFTSYFMYLLPKPPCCFAPHHLTTLCLTCTPTTTKPWFFYPLHFDYNDCGINYTLLFD